jgi:hypothetical protein
MRNAVLVLVAFFALAGASPGQTQRPDFSGVWQLDVSRSDFAAHNPTPGPVIVEITQTDSELRIVTKNATNATTLQYRLVAEEGAARPVAGTAPTARWKGNALLTDSVRDIRGQSVVVQQTRTLSADGNEMVVESLVNVQHGYTLAGAQTYGASRDVFVRVPR